jgi:hypothetical protein
MTLRVLLLLLLKDKKSCGTVNYLFIFYFACKQSQSWYPLNVACKINKDYFVALLWSLWLAIRQPVLMAIHEAPSLSCSEFSALTTLPFSCSPHIWVSPRALWDLSDDKHMISFPPWLFWIWNTQSYYVK